MNWFPFLHRDPPRPDEPAIAPGVLDAAIDRLVSLTNPRLALLDRYRERLAPAAEVACAYAHALALSLPAVVDANPARWASSDVLRAFFVSGDDLVQVYGGSVELRRLFRNDPSLDCAHVMLTMRHAQQKVLGMALDGDTVQRDVPQTTLSFSRHRISICAGSEAQLHDAVAWKVIDHLGVRALSRLAEFEDRRHELEIDRALLKARLRMHERQGAGLQGGDLANGDLAHLEAELTANAKELSAVGGGTTGLECVIDVLSEVLAEPSAFVRCTNRRVKLSQLNVLLEASDVQPHLDVEFAEVHLDADPPTMIAMMPTRFPRDALPLQMPSIAKKGLDLL